MNFTKNSNMCTKKVKHATWTRLYHEYHNKQENNPFFWNMSTYRSHMQETYFNQKVTEEWKFYSKIYPMHQEGIQRYNKLGESIDEYCLTKEWTHTCVYTMTYYPCENGYTINVKSKPCIVDKQTLVRRNIREKTRKESTCFSVDMLMLHEKINFKQLTYINYIIPHVYDYGPANNILRRCMISIEKKGMFLIYGYFKHYNNFVEGVKRGINERGKYFKEVDYVSIIEYEAEVSQLNILHNTTVRVTRRDKYANERNMFVIIHTLCCQNTTPSCPAMSKNLYKRFTRNTNECWEETREMVYF